MIVVKCGGAAGVDTAAVCRDLAALAAGGERLVLVHGGSAATDALARRLGLPVRRMVAPSGISSRRTDAAMLDVLLMAVLGTVKPALVAELAGYGVRAVGLSGLDAGMVRCRRKRAVRALVDGRPTVVRDDRSGRIIAVDTAPLRAVLAAGGLPVLSPPGLDEDDRPVNVDADRMAAAVAAALKAAHLVLLTAAPGVLADPADPASLLGEYAVDTSPRSGIGGGMAVKLLAAGEALAGGVGAVTIAAGRGDRPVQRALRGAGTRIVWTDGPAHAGARGEDR